MAETCKLPQNPTRSCNPRKPTKTVEEILAGLTYGATLGKIKKSGRGSTRTEIHITDESHPKIITEDMPQRSESPASHPWIHWIHAGNRMIGYSATQEEWDNLMYKHALGNLQEKLETEKEIERRKVREHKLGACQELAQRLRTESAQRNPKAGLTYGATLGKIKKSGRGSARTEIHITDESHPKIVTEDMPQRSEWPASHQWIHWIHAGNRMIGYSATQEEWDNLMYKCTLGNLQEKLEAKKEIERRKVREHKLGACLELAQRLRTESAQRNPKA